MNTILLSGMRTRISLRGTLFEKLPEDWVCPECAESKDMFM